MSLPPARGGLRPAVALLASLSLVSTARSAAQETDVTPSDIAELYSRSVAQVLVEAGDAGSKQGTAFAVDAAGLYATSLHLLDGATRVWIRTARDEKHEIEFVQAFDISHDLVVVRIAPQQVAVPPLGASADLQIGDPVVVIGNPLGLARSVTDGILSARREPQPPRDDVLYDDDAPFDRDLLLGVDCELLQISAPVAPGASGGPVFDLRGRVVGIEMGGFGGGALDLNFAIPVEGLAPLIDTHGALDLAGLQRRIDEERRDAASEFLQNARLALELDDPSTAERELDRALAHFPRYTEAILLRGQLAIARGELGEAEQLLVDATELSPDSAAIWNALGLIYLGDHGNGRRQIPKARACFQRTLDLEPGHPGATYGMGAVLLEEGRVVAAIEQLGAAFRDNPELSRAGYLLGTIYLGRHRFIDAREIFDEILWNDPDYPPAHYGRAFVAYYLDEGSNESAHWDTFLELAEDDPRYASMLERALAFLRAVRPHLLPSRYR